MNEQNEFERFQIVLSWMRVLSNQNNHIIELLKDLGEFDVEITEEKPNAKKK